MIKYTREENGVAVSLEIDNESYTSEDVIEIIEKINTTVEIKELKAEVEEETPYYNIKEGN